MGMYSLRQLYKIGPGPSSSHTIGPMRAAVLWKQEFPHVTHTKIVLYGSLGLTGPGHQTDAILRQTLTAQTLTIEFQKMFVGSHPNAMDFWGYVGDQQVAYWRVYSIGGGDLQIDQKPDLIDQQIRYPFASMVDIKQWLQQTNQTPLVFIFAHEDGEIKHYLSDVVNAMFQAVEKGLKTEGTMPGALKLERVAKKIHQNALEISQNGADISEVRRLKIASYAYAVSESNAAGEQVVTAPTCGASGVLPALLYYYYQHQLATFDQIVEALAVGGIFGNLIKANASISGAVGGCQAEVGSACSMAAAAVGHLMGLPFDKIEYAAEVAMEHHLGLTCDPVLGLVQIPCIERNAAAALRAYDAAIFGKFIGALRKNRVSFDDVVQVMKETGDQLTTNLKETSLGGLAKQYLAGIHND